MARRQGLFTDLMELASMLPWQAGLALALVSYLICHALAGAGVIGPPPTNPAQLGDVARGQLTRVLAHFLQVILPIGFLAGATGSFLRRRKREVLFGLASSDGEVAINRMSWREFEMLVGEAFRRRGYEVAETGGKGVDGGVDLILRKDGKRFLVQCKQWRARQVGVSVVRELYGVMAAEQAAGGFVITSGSFTREAREFASGRTVELIDGVGLARLTDESGRTR